MSQQLMIFFAQKKKTTSDILKLNSSQLIQMLTKTK